MSEHFAERAALIAALPPTDPEALSAADHLRSCATCAQALEQGRHLMSLLDAAPPAMPLPADALARATDAIRAHDRREKRAKSPAYPAAAVLAACALEVAIAKHRDASQISLLEGASVLIVAGLVAVLSGVRARVATALGVVASAALVWLAASAPGLSPIVGAKCVVLELLGAAIPFVATAWLASRGRVVLGAWRGAGVASAGALAAQAGLHLTCKVAHQGFHLLAFHLGGVLLAALVGYEAGNALTKRQVADDR